MRKLSVLLSLSVCMAVALAQEPKEIVSRMEAEMARHEGEGMAMTVEMRIPLLGTVTTRTWTLGDNYKMKASVKNTEVTTWGDGLTKWTYNAKNNELVIENEQADKSASDGSPEMFSGIADGYEVTLRKESSEAWYFQCKKSKTNKDADDPKSMDLVIAKETYHPLSLSTKMSGISLVLSDISFGVVRSDVTFDMGSYPDALVKDKR